MADKKSKYQKSKTDPVDNTQATTDRRALILDYKKAVDLQSQLASRLDEETKRLLNLNEAELEAQSQQLELELQASTKDIIAARKLGYDFSGNLRYSNLLFKPSYNYPSYGISSVSPASSINEITWSQLPTVTIYAHTLSAPEFAIVDELILVEDITGDGFGFEETFNVPSTSTTSFNTAVNNNNIVTEVRLARKIFSKNCYANQRTYQLTYSSGHQQDIVVSPPSPCAQNSSLFVDLENVNYNGWERSYCANEDYRSRYSVNASMQRGISGSYQNIVRCVNQGGASAFEESKFLLNSIGLLSKSDSFNYNVSTNLGNNFPTKGDCAIENQQALGLDPNSYLSGSTEYGAPYQINLPQISKLEHVITRVANNTNFQGIPTTATSGASPYTNFEYIQTPNIWFRRIEEEGQQSLLDSSGGEMMLQEGSYAVIREYTYSENLINCSAPPALDIEVCLDSSSPSYYLTTQVDCNGTDITNYVNGTKGDWNPVAGPKGCCAIDCSNFIMTATSTSSSFGDNNGTIFIDFTNGTGTSVGTPDNTANEHSYDVALTHSAGTAITQNGNAAYASGAAFTDATCDTASGSSIVACNSNASITIGMAVTGTGITDTAYVGAITGGTPGAVTGFQLSSSPGSNIPVNSSGAQTNTTLTFSIDSRRFVWGSLPPTIGGDHYELSVTDENGCVYSQLFSITEDAPSLGCTDNTAINYSSSFDDKCAPDCCVFCNATTGFTENGDGGFLNSAFSFVNSSTIAATTNAATDGSITLNGFLEYSLIPYITSTMSYKYSLYALSSSANFDSAGSALATDTSTLAQGVTSSFTGLAYGYYGIKIEIEDSSTGSDAGLEKCFQWVSGNVKANVCTDSQANNFENTVPINLQLQNSSICNYEEGCDCEVSVEAVQDGCGVNLIANLGCSSTSPILVRWTLPSGQNFSVTYLQVSEMMTVGLPSNNVTESGLYSFELTDNGGSGACVTNVLINVELPICGCTDANALNYDLTATVDNDSCIYCQYGCTDPAADNYDPIATCDDNSCVTAYGGCIDPSASNYDAGAYFSDGSCLYEGCLDRTALNYLNTCDGIYNPNISINRPNCCTYCTPPPYSIDSIVPTSIVTGCISGSTGRIQITSYENGTSQFYDLSVTDSSGAVITTSSNIATGTSTIVRGLSIGVYNFTITDSNGCSVDDVFVIDSDSTECGCTSPGAFNYNSNATVDDGSCYYAGCTDPLAANYSPSATISDGSCNYNIVPNPCQIPSATQSKIDSKIFGCLTLKGATYLNKIRIGYSDDCSVMNQWKLVLVNYLLHKKELDCMYNCSDDMTSLPVGLNTCEEKWTTGGARTGVNDQAHAGSEISSGEGTTITNSETYFVAGNSLYAGDVIKMPSGLIWEVVSGVCDFGCFDPESQEGSSSGNWVQCTSLSNFTNTNTTNYLDPFIRFMNEQCDKCAEDPKCTEQKLKGKG